MKTDEEILKRGTGNFINCTDYDDAIQALGDLRSETEDKAMLFAEWTHMVKRLVWSAYRKAWVYTTATTVREYTTAELFTSPEFLAYYEERRGE